MTLILELSPEVEARIKAEAIASGVTIEAMAIQILTQWSQGLSVGLPPLSNEVTERESTQSSEKSVG